MRTLYVYILANRSRTLYIGVTSNLMLRMAEHRARTPGSFTARYRIDRLVHVEAIDGPMNAIRREKQLKGWVRRRKVALIESANPEWRDLAESWDPSLRSG